MRLLGLCLVAIVAAAGAFGIRASMPAGAQGGGHFAIDTNIDNGVCGPVDGSASVGQSGTLKVAICWLNSTEPPEAFTLDIGYDTAFMTVPDGNASGGALDDNPDANAGLTTFGTQTLGNEWDCTTFGIQDPVGDSDKVPGGDALMNCNANLGNPDLHLTNGAMAVITFQTGTKAGTTQISFLNTTSAAGEPRNVVRLRVCEPGDVRRRERDGGGRGGYGDAGDTDAGADGSGSGDGDAGNVRRDAGGAAERREHGRQRGLADADGAANCGTGEPGGGDNADRRQPGVRERDGDGGSWRGSDLAADDAGAGDGG